MINILKLKQFSFRLSCVWGLWEFSAVFFKLQPLTNCTQVSGAQMQGGPSGDSLMGSDRQNVSPGKLSGGGNQCLTSGCLMPVLVSVLMKFHVDSSIMEEGCLISREGKSFLEPIAMEGKYVEPLGYRAG